jgi:hypothetical protein
VQPDEGTEELELDCQELTLPDGRVLLLYSRDAE